MQERHHSRNGGHTIFGMGFVASLVPTLLTSVQQNELAVLKRDVDNQHGSTTLCRAITRIHIDVLGTQARRAVIAIPITNDICLTIFAHKIFLPSLKRFCVNVSLHLLGFLFPRACQSAT